MLLKLILLLTSLGCLKAASKFSSTINYPTLSEDGVYRYVLHVEEALTMAINNHAPGKFDPVDYNITDRRFYARNKNVRMACNLSTVVTDQDKLDTIITANGRHRQVLLMNGQFPGPSIIVPKGAKMEITVHNHLRLSGLSMHWHGQIQKDTFQMDGVTRITQCPIMPGEFYTYKFTASEAGTHWYHSHASTQRTDGLVGAFIVIDPQGGLNESQSATENQQSSASGSQDGSRKMPSDPRYAKEFLFFVQDWIKLDSETAVNYPIWGNTKFMNGYERDAPCFSPLRIHDGSMMMLNPDTFIINGKGWYDMPKRISMLDSFASTAPSLPLEHFEVLPNKRYLFRAIGSNMGLPIMIHFNQHKLTLVATDGNPIVPIRDLDYVVIHGGERYDFEIETKNSTASNFYVIIQALAAMEYSYENLTRDYFGIGILDYKAEGEKLAFQERKCSPKSPCRISNCFFLPKADLGFECIDVARMQAAKPVSKEASDSMLFKKKYQESEFEEKFFNIHFAGPLSLRSAINGKQYMLPRAPPYFFPDRFEQSIEGMECPDTCQGEETCKCSSLTRLTAGKVIQLTFYNMGKGAGQEGTSHPVHLHGYHFYVIATGYPEYDNKTGFYLRGNKDIDCAQDDTKYCNGVGWSNPEHSMGNVPGANFVDPPKKDTVMVPVGGYVVVRFLADNLGYWFLHCHIEVHATEGMSTLIQVGTHENIRQKVDWNNLNSCFKGFTKPSAN